MGAGSPIEWIGATRDPLAALDLHGIHRGIVGGASGTGARPMDPTWVRDLPDPCVAARVPFFLEQWGGVNKKKTGRLLDGRTWDELPRPRRASGPVRRALPVLATAPKEHLA